MSISFVSKYYDGFPLPNNFYSKEVQEELSQSISSLILTYSRPHCLENLDLQKQENTAICELDYSNGLLKLKTNKNNFLLDMVNINFFFTILLPHLQSLGENVSENLLQLKGRLESVSGYKEAEKVSQIYFSCLRKYIDSYEGNKITPNINPVKKFSEYLLCTQGLKSFRYLKPPFLLFTSPTIGDISMLSNKQECRFTKFVKKLSQSFSSFEGKTSKKWITFLQAGLDCRVSYEDKCLFLRQVIFFVLFKEFLFSMISSKISTETAHSQLEFLRFSLSRFSFSDPLMMIPLACRFPTPIDLAKKISLFVSQDFIAQSIEKANVAYERFIRVFSQSCNFTLEELGAGSSTSSVNQEEVNKFIRGLSSLAISGGPFARHSFYQYCLQSGEDLSENIPLEIILAATEHSLTENTSMEEIHLGYFLKMLGIFPGSELNEIQLAIHEIGDFIQKISIDNSLKINEIGEYSLSDNALKKFTKYYLKGQKQLQKKISFFQQKKTPTISCLIS